LAAAETALGDALAREEVARNLGGMGLFAVGMLIIVGIVWAIAQNPQAVAQSLLTSFPRY